MRATPLEEAVADEGLPRSPGCRVAGLTYGDAPPCDVGAAMEVRRVLPTAGLEAWPGLWSVLRTLRRRQLRKRRGFSDYPDRSI
jgi:hypothetical protein